MKRLLVMTLVTFTLTIFPASAHADIMQTVGDSLKKAGTVAVDLFKKGKDKVMGLFASADPTKIPYLIKKLQESQYAISAKQQGLLELYGSSANTNASGGRPIGDAYIQERVNDLQIAREENLKALEELKKLVEACESKKKDYSQYKTDLGKVEQAQGTIDKNQATLEQKLAKYMNTNSTSGSSDENPSGLSEDELAAKFNSADNPYTSAGVGKSSDTAEEGADPSYEPGLTTNKPATASSTSIDPNSGEVKSLIDGWLAMKGLDPYGRLLGKGITAAGNADTGGMTRETWLMANIPELRQYVKANMGKGTTSAVAAASVAPDTSTSEERPSAGNGVATSTASPSAPVSSALSTAEANSSSNATREALTSNIASGTGTTDETLARYNSYLEADKKRREVLAQQHQATSQP